MKSSIAIVVSIFVILSTAITMSAQNVKRDQDLNNFKTLYEQELKQNGIVGSSFVFLGDNKVIAADYYGSANLAKNQAVDENTIYHWASNTKPFTGIAIMQLRDRGLLKLDDPVTKYLPELRAVHNPFGSVDEITIRHLLTHSAGFRGGTWPWSTGKDWEPFEPTDYSQLVATSCGFTFLVILPIDCRRYETSMRITATFLPWSARFRP